MDSSALIDLFGDSPAAEAVAETLRDALRAGPVVVCEVVLAEICAALKDGSQVLQDIEDAGIRFLATEARAALRAGEMQRRYRQRSGQRAGHHDRAVPDFLIGAHALLQCTALITRDAAFFRDYFKGLKVISPRA